ncbi:MAG: hypothetical protein P9M15_02750 [Candidatus Electryoneaceae bacterium]|nr:hypothetical protein [Candidatus Electryoneaceae bacterium]
MNQLIYRYRFGPEISMADVGASLLLSVIAVGSLEGHSRLLLEGRHRFDHAKRYVEVDADTNVGESIARIFTGFLSLELGDRGFEVERRMSSCDVEPSLEPAIETSETTQ